MMSFIRQTVNRTESNDLTSKTFKRYSSRDAFRLTVVPCTLQTSQDPIIEYCFHLSHIEGGRGVDCRVSFESSFDTKQPKLESKLASALSETNCLFRLFRCHIEAASFCVSVKPKLLKQTESS